MLDIIEEHFEELDFLLAQRESVIFAPDWTLEELAQLEERAEAHLDGLRVAELHAVDLARPALAGKECFAAMAAALLFCSLRDVDLEREVVRALEAPSGPGALIGLRLALRHSPIESVLDALRTLAESSDLAVAASAIDVLTFHGVTTVGHARLLGSEEPSDRALAWGAMGRARVVRQGDLTEVGLQDGEASVRWAALHGAALSGLVELPRICRDSVASRPPTTEVLAFLGIVGDPQDRNILESATADSQRALDALYGLGALGSAEAVPVLIERMKESGPIATRAAEAFARITGESDVATPVEEGTPQDGERDRPIDVDRVLAWWKAHRSRFAPQRRWQCGRDVTDAPGLVDGLSLQSRRDLYLSSCVRSTKQVPPIELEARARRQRIG